MPKFIDKNRVAGTVVTSDSICKCPECGAQLVVNLRGHRQFTCGREDIIVGDPQAIGFVVTSMVSACRMMRRS